MSDNNNNVGGVLVAFMAGMLVGAGLGLLYAPQSGKETRKLIAKKAEELKDEAEEIIDDTLEKSKKALREKKDQFDAALEAGKEAMVEARDKIKKAVS
ncbi:MAG: YtxH domain-containing protein [Verrucomicrobia bacterium]|nr:YtxH domain-containing protein [Verrucomicrobiota bacterium]